MNLQEVRWGHGRDWSGSGLCYVAEFSEGRNESSFAIKWGEFLDWGLVSFSKKKSVCPLTQPVKLKLDLTCILRVRATRTWPSLWPLVEFHIRGVGSFDICYHSVIRPLYIREVLQRMATVTRYSRNFLSGVEKRILNVP